MINKLDKIIERSLRRLAKDTHARSWCAKERDWVNYFAHRYLVGECSRRGPLKELGQICIEVAVPQPPKYEKQSVSRDLVIWPNCGDTCFDVDWKARKHPLAILEWKVHRKGHKSRQVEKERAWLRAYCKRNKEVVAYAIEIDGVCYPTQLVCCRFLGSTETTRWLALGLGDVPSNNL